MGKEAAVENRRLQTQFLTLTHLGKVDFLSLGRFGCFQGRYPTAVVCSSCLTGGREGARAWLSLMVVTSGCPCAVYYWKLILCLSLWEELAPVSFGAGTMCSGACLLPAYLEKPAAVVATWLLDGRGQ